MLVVVTVYEVINMYIVAALHSYTPIYNVKCKVHGVQYKCLGFKVNEDGGIYHSCNVQMP